MRGLHVPLLSIVGWVGAVVLSGCGSNTLFPPEQVASFSTLTVKYVDAGPTPDPCDDRLPAIDGIAQDQEWAAAEPLFLRMSGEDGNGGEDFFLELRALWTDEGKFGSGGSNRIYFLVRYADNDLNNEADLLAYGHLMPTGEIDPSPTPVYDAPTQTCDGTLVDPSSWVRLNPNGREDQVLLALAAYDETRPVDMVAANRRLLGAVGNEVPTGFTIPGVGDLDVWIWRATRTNIQPVFQFARWADYVPGRADFTLGEVDVPDAAFTRFTVKSGFCQDLFVDDSGTLIVDSGNQPFVKNFQRNDPVPDRITQLEPKGKGGGGMGEKDETIINGGLPKDLALWWNTSKRFGACDTVATSRVGTKKFKWSDRLLPGDFDRMAGWGIQTPTGSARDVRAKANFDTIQDKGFSTRTIEIMRDIDTGNSDDLLIEAGKVYRLVIGVYDASGTTASGSKEIRLIFEPVHPVPPGPERRC